MGCEVYVSIGNYTDKTRVVTSSGKKWGYNHLVLLAQNKTGYNNLMKLVSIGYLEGFYYRPRVDKKLLQKYPDDKEGSLDKKLASLVNKKKCFQRND